MVAAPIAVNHPARRGTRAMTEKAPIRPTAMIESRVCTAVATWRSSSS